MYIVLAIALPLLSSLLITPGIIRLARGIGAYDLPNERKVHTQPVPRLGGLAVYVSFFLMVVLILAADRGPFISTWFFSLKGAVFIASLVVVALLGIWDDFRSLKPGLKFGVQALIATGCYLAGFHISAVTDPFSAGLFQLGALDYPITVLWIVGVTNAFNLIDGLDGLASGVGIIASFTIFMITLLSGDIATALLALVLTGSLLGFLRYNFNPARIFLGDSGSLFIGLVLALLSIQSSTKGSTAVAILIPFLALGFPIMDTLLSMTRRLLGSFLPDYDAPTTIAHKVHSMFLPDRRHIHHQLLALGLTHRTAVLTLYLVSCLFGAGAFAATMVNNAGTSLIVLAFAVAMFAGIRRLHYNEMEILRNGVLLPIYEWPIINRSMFQGIFDLGFIVAAFSIAFYLTVGHVASHALRLEFLSVLPVVGSIQITVFYAFGLYRGTFRHLGVGDLMKIVRTVAVAVIVTSITSALIIPIFSWPSLSLFIIDFYILLTLIAGSRMSFHVLNYLFRKVSKTGKKILIYGADADGVLTLQHILSDGRSGLTPTGFLDDNPQLQGKRVNGYEVFGGHWKLPRLLKKYNIEEILISSDNVRPIALRRMKQVADVHGISLKRTKVLWEDVSLPPVKRRARPDAVVIPRRLEQEEADDESLEMPYVMRQKPVSAERHRRAR
jgi:UDP-GlcNAc:undecaprenyl-phosphate GlcNAc-1-phosphate transferase